MVYSLQYLRGTVNVGISFSKSTIDMHAFTDADSPSVPEPDPHGLCISVTNIVVYEHKY